MIAARPETGRMAAEPAGQGAAPPSRAPVRLFWLLLGSLALTLGSVGAILPLLPTTPFILLAAFAFGRSMPAWQAALESNPIYGPIIETWHTHRAIAPRHKAISIGMMAVVFGASLAAGLDPIVITVQALCLGGAATFILTRPSGHCRALSSPRGALPTVPR